MPDMSTRPHGTRARYVGGKCRCFKCRLANADYYHERKGKEFNGLVSAAPARRHLLKLRSVNVGRRAVAEVSGVALSTLRKIVKGESRQVMAETRRKILAVTSDARSDHSLVPAEKTQRIIHQLTVVEGLSKKELARRLGLKRPALQLGKGPYVTALNEMKVARLYARMMEI